MGCVEDIVQTSEYSSQPVRINPTGGNPQHQQHQEYSRGNQGQPNAPVQNSFPQQYNYPQQPNNFPQQQGYYPQQQPSENVYPQQQPQNISNPIVANPKQIAVQSKPPSSQTELPKSTKEASQETFRFTDNYIVTKRGKMLVDAKDCDDFLDHHLANEITMSNYTSTKKIRSRQILEHIYLLQAIPVSVGPNSSNVSEFTIKSWMQSQILEIFEKADREFFEEHKSIDEVRQKIAEKYLFELYQLKEFFDAGLSKYSIITDVTRINMSEIMVKSDSALYPALKYLKDKYPQVADNSKIAFPAVKELKNDVNLLNNFPSRCFSEPGWLNIQTLFSDLKFLIDKSVEQFADFQSDMKAMLGDDVLTDSKVKKDPKSQGVGMKDLYTASPVRRVFIKWAETIIERIPDIIVSKTFINFIRSKSEMAENFFFKSTVQPTTHKLVIEYLSELLETAKYDLRTGEKRKEFGFFIYDLLRCKTKRNTGEEIVQLLEKMKTTTVTPSGKKFEVVRVKDRFKTPNRDLMVNFRYGDVIVGEAQLCIDTSDVSDKVKKVNKFNHYIYELERGLFGPTFELIMQYEDFQRTDIAADLEAEGKVQPRINSTNQAQYSRSGRKCFNGHEMLCMTGNHFSKGTDGNYSKAIPISCDYCNNVFTSESQYHYCYFCTLLFCLVCEEPYKKENIKELTILINKTELIPVVKTEAELIAACQKTKSVIAVFLIETGAANKILHDFLIYLMCIYRMQKRKLPNIVFVQSDQPQATPMLEKYHINRFPTTIVFTNTMNPQCVIIGASTNEMEVTFEIQERLSTGQSTLIEFKCFCGESMRLAAWENEEEEPGCFTCWCANKISIIDSIFNFEGTEVFACPSGHTRCLKCSYLAKNGPTMYRDMLGKSYLSVPMIKPKSQKCSNGHALQHFLINVQANWQYNCLFCRKLFLFSNEEGMGGCLTCKVFACPECIGIEKESFSSKAANDLVELVSHLAESTAEEGYRCLCKQLFKKTYKTRVFNKEEGGMTSELYNKMCKSALNEPKNYWHCIVCKNQFEDGKLHVACFLCPIFVENKVRESLEFCMDCTIKAGLLQREIEPKCIEAYSQLLCKSNHQVIRTSLAYDQSLTYSCNFCKKNFYIHTERYYCPTCKINCCEICSGRCLRNPYPPTCLHSCNEGHQLEICYEPRRLDLCDHCSQVIKKTHFRCPEECGFSLCLGCAASPIKINQVPAYHPQQQQQVEQENDSENNSNGPGILDGVFDGDLF